MSAILKNILVWAERQLPEDKRMWISDLRSDARHIPSGMARQRFLWSGVLAALGQVLRIRFGVQRVGQALLGLVLFSGCLILGVFVMNMEDSVVKMAFYGLLAIYTVTSALTFLNLRMLKCFTVVCSLTFATLWGVSWMTFFASLDVPVDVLRALMLEAAVMMTMLFIAASYLGWIEEADRA